MNQTDFDNMQNAFFANKEETPLFAEKNERANFSEYLNYLYERKSKELSELQKIRKHVQAGYSLDVDGFVSAVKDYASLNESNALYAKMLCKKSWEKPVKGYESLAGTEEFELGLDPDYGFFKLSEGHYKFILPPLISKHNADKKFSDGKYIRECIKHYLILYKKQSGVSLPRMKKARLTFIHHLPRIGKTLVAPDPDNLDIKSAIDALQPTLLENDTIFDIELHQMGVVSDKAFTELQIDDLRA